MKNTNDSVPKAKSLKLRQGLFLAATALQVGCGVVFTLDIFFEWRALTLHVAIEAMGVVALAIGAMLSLREYRAALRANRQILSRNFRVEQELRAATGFFQEVVEQHFDTWQLTEAERDVALLSIKGASIAEIAAMRETREGTIKAQIAAIYRKSGVSSRAELVSVVIEELISGLGVSSLAPVDAPVAKAGPSQPVPIKAWR
jgi:DNA-binding CsgD family transcriptional regulator